MSIFPIFLALSAAAMHATWNMLVKRSGGRQALTLLALTAGAVFYSPFLILYGKPPADVWPYALVSALIEAAYFLFLIRAYQFGDFSLVYPVARGAAPAILAVLAAVFLNDRPSRGGIFGLGLILIGLIMIGGSPLLKNQKQVRLSLGGTGSALVVALCIAFAAVVDARAVRIMSPLPYTELVLSLSVFGILPVILLRKGSKELLQEARANGFRAVIIGLLMFSAYGLVLKAFTLANVSYVGAMREVSVVMAALIGWKWLGEEFGSLRVLGSIIIFCGIYALAIIG